MGDAGNMTPPQRYVVRKPSGDPDAARALASAYDALADGVVAQLRRASAVLDGLGATWHGNAAQATGTPEQVLSHDGARVCGALHHCADDLRHYAHRLAQAHEHHGWSLGKLVTLGAVVTIGAAAVVVTVGAAAPAEAAMAAAAVEGAEAATAAAGAASSSAATALAGWQALLAGVRPLAPFVVPHLISSGASVGLDAVSELAGGHGLDAHSLEVSAAVGFAGSAAGGAVERSLLSYAQRTRRLAEAGLWAANGTAGSYADKGTVDPLDSLAYGLTGGVARDVRFGVEETRLMWALRVPQLPLGFESKYKWRRFVTRLYDGLDGAGYRDAVVAFRGSSVTGFNFRHGYAFDSRYRSDWDLAIVHGGALDRALAHGIKAAGERTRTAPLKDLRHFPVMRIEELTEDLWDMGDRPIQWMIYRDMHALQARNQPYILVPRP
jgi:uncharacterized protein YukE